MAITLATKGRVAIKQQGAWGTPETSFASTDYLEVESPFIPPLARETLRPNVYQPGYDEPNIEAGSKAPVEVSFRFPLHGCSTATPSADPTIFPDALLFKMIMGDAAADAYSTANLGGGTPADQETTYTNGTADTAWAGYASSYPTAGLRTIGWISTVNTGASPDEVTFAADTARDVTTGTAYGSLVAWLSTTAQLPATFDWIGSEGTSYIRYSDGLPTSVKAVFASKQLVAVEVTMRFLSWSNLGTGGALTPAAYAYPLIPAVIEANGTEMRIGGTATCFATATLEVTQELAEAPCGGSTEGVSMLVHTNRRVTLEIVHLDSDLSTIGLGSVVTAGSSVGVLQLDASTITAGRSFSLLIPAPVLLEQPTLQDLGGLLATRVLLGCRTFSSDTGTTAPADTIARVAWL